MQINDYSWPGQPEDKPVALSNVIPTYCCPQCGGRVALVSDYLHGIMLRVEGSRADLYQILGDVPPPGRAVITTCKECRGRHCSRCGHGGKTLWRACPRCGDVGFDYINGRNEVDGMVCGNGCGFKWAANDLRWLAQRVTASSQAALEGSRIA